MTKPIYPVIMQIVCPRCGNHTEHILYDYNYTIYQCTKCGNIHA